MGEEAVTLTLKHLTDSLEKLVGGRLDKLEAQIQELLDKLEAQTPPGPPAPPGKPTGSISFAAKVPTDAAAPPPPPPQEQQQQQQQGSGAAVSPQPVSAEAPTPPVPPPASPPPPAHQPKSLEGPPPLQSLGGPVAVAAQMQAASTPPGPEFIEVQLQRSDEKATWGFLWDRPAFINKQRIIDDIVPDSPAGRFNKDQQGTGGRLKKGDELIALDGGEGWDACSQLSKMTKVRIKFRCAPETNVQASVSQPPQPDPETDPETGVRAGDLREIAPPGTVLQDEQERSAKPMPLPEANETREKKIEKQMTYLRKLSDSKKESSTGQASGVTSLMTQVEDLNKLANLLAQGEATEALALVQPLLRKQVQTGKNGEPDYAAVDDAEAARFLLEVMEMMESSSKSGNATILAKP